MRRAAAGLCSRKTRISFDSISPAFSLSKFPGKLFGRADGRSSEGPRSAFIPPPEALGHPMQAFEVVGQADQLPFQSHFFFPAQKKLPESQNALDDAKDRFDGLLPQFILGFAGGSLQPVFHHFTHTGSGGRRDGVDIPF